VGAGTVDQVRTLYRTLLFFAAVSVLILVAGRVALTYTEPPDPPQSPKGTPAPGSL